MKKTLCSLFFILVLVVGYSQYTKLLDFAGTTNGNYPGGSLISVGTFLYGMTGEGGANNMGTIFKIKPDGTGYVKLLDFAGTINGREPLGSLISVGTFLYGMTYWGGVNDLGIIFKIKPDGTGFSKLLDFAGATNGSWPCGRLISDGTFLYGTTELGGTSDMGVIFKIKPDGTGYAKLLDFAGTTNGSYPVGSLISDGAFLYGMTWGGGSGSCNFGCGTIFKIKPDGTGYLKLLDFEGTTNGSKPYGSLISDGAYLYGMTWEGGTNDKGVIFKIKPDGTGYLKLLDFAGVSNGSNPNGELISDGTFLYGVTKLGGTNNLGVLFRIKPNGTGYTKLLDFAGATNGSMPSGYLISDGSFLYGMTSVGGTNDLGTVFKYVKPNGIDENYLVNNFNIYPNPSNNIITITNLEDFYKEIFVSISNSQGVLVLSKTFNMQNPVEIDVSSLARGVYVIKIQAGDGFETKKLVIQ